MISRKVMGASLAMALLAGCVVAAESVKSGLQPGDDIPGPFDVQNVTGSAAGRKACQI
jgi:hypothetical protein